MSLTESESELVSENKQGVKKLFIILINRAIEKDTKIEYRNADYKKFLKFIDVAYESVAMVYVKNVMSKIDETTFNIVVDRFTELCKDISYLNFSRWINNNKDVFSLYNINASNMKDKYMQISFYERTKQIMFYIYESLNYDSYGWVKANYDNSIKAYELMKNEIRFKREKENNEYIDYSIEELEWKLDIEKDKENSLEDEGKENVSRREIIESIYNILTELMNRRNQLSKSKFIKYSREQKKYWIKLLKTERINLNESYMNRVRKDILLENTEFNIGCDPFYVELVSRCIKKLKENPWMEVDEVIKDISDRMNDENYLAKKEKIIANNDYIVCETTYRDGSKRIHIEPKGLGN